MLGPYKTISRMSAEELEAAFGEDAYWLVGIVYWHWLRVITVIVSVIAVAVILYFLPVFSPILRNLLATVTVLYVTVLSIYYVWSELLHRSIHIAFLRRYRHDTFGPQDLHGEIGWQVAIQVSAALILVVIGYIALGCVYGGAYYGTNGSTASKSFADSIYFSFVTMGTIGYGDIQPQGFGKVLACTQNISQLLYQVTAIAGIVAIIGKITGEPENGLGFTFGSDEHESAQQGN